MAAQSPLVARGPWPLLCAAACAVVSGDQRHWWPHSRGDVGSYGHTTIVGPSNLSALLAWRWREPTLAILPGAVLLDERKHLYVPSLAGIRKFSPDGDVLWFHETFPYHRRSEFPPPGFYTHACPSLMGGALYGGGIGPHVYSLDIETGQLLWRRLIGREGQEMDCPYIEAHEGVVMAAHARRPDKATQFQGNTRVTALNASDGSTLWEYDSEMVLWNFHPIFPGDGTFTSMDIHGGVYRRRLRDGGLVWHTPASLWSFTDGGQILGKDGGLYACANLAYGQADTPGVLRKYRLEDGKQLWEQILPQPCVSWPASDGEQVVVPVGALPLPVPPAYQLLEAFIPHTVKFLMHMLSRNLGDKQGWLWGNKPAHLEVLAFDPETGKRKWHYDQIPPWTRVSSLGDEDLLFERLPAWGDRSVCGPASWSAPTIGGDGTVYAAAMNGVLYAIRDANSDGIIDDSAEVSRLTLGDASLHAGASFAPGLMAFASCAELYVFRF